MGLEILKITKIDVCLLSILSVSLAYSVRKNLFSRSRDRKPRPRNMQAIIQQILITKKQTEKLDIKKSTRLSTLFEKCCLRQIANLSYSKAAQ